MPKKPVVKRIQLDKPNEHIAQVKERLAALEVEEKKRNPEFEIPIARR